MSTEATAGLLERLFRLSEKHTTVRTELIAGATTFIALAYIMFVNPNILSEAGVPKEAAIAATTAKINSTANTSINVKPFFIINWKNAPHLW